MMHTVCAITTHFHVSRRKKHQSKHPYTSCAAVASNQQVRPMSAAPHSCPATASGECNTQPKQLRGNFEHTQQRACAQLEQCCSLTTNVAYAASQAALMMRNGMGKAPCTLGRIVVRLC
jgi:hypothetical protein